MADRIGADAPDSQAVNPVQTSLVQPVEVAADIVLIPRAECGPIRVTYLPVESDSGEEQAGATSEDEPYRVTVVQEMLVEIPLTFQIDAACEGVTCAPLPGAWSEYESESGVESGREPGSGSELMREPGSGSELGSESWSENRPAPVAARDLAGWQPWQSRKGPLWTWRVAGPPQGGR